LGNPIVRSVEDHQLDVILEFSRSPCKCPPYGLPSAAAAKRLDVLHAEGPRRQSLDNIEEVMNMLRSRIIGIHAPYDRKALAGRATNHDVRLKATWRLVLRNSAMDYVLPKIGFIGLHSVLI
jgi:hypothetical protein